MKTYTVTARPVYVGEEVGTRLTITTRTDNGFVKHSLDIPRSLVADVIDMLGKEDAHDEGGD